MFKVPIDKIIPVTSARAKIASLVNDVQEKKSLYVLTRSGRPAAILASVEFFDSHQSNNASKKKSLDANLVSYKSTSSLPQTAKKTTTAIDKFSNTENVPTNQHDDEEPVEISVNS